MNTSTKPLIPTAIDHARISVGASRRRGQIPEDATREWLVAELEHAGRTLQSLPAHGVWPSGERSFWPDVVHAAEVAYGWTAERPRPPRPDASSIARMDLAYGWIGLIPETRRTWRRLVLLRSLVDPFTDRHKFSWRRIAQQFGRDHKFWKAEWERAVGFLFARISEGD